MAYKVAIDASKGGNNSGVSANGLVEKDYTLEVSKYMNDRLNELGVESFLVRDNDDSLTDEQRVNIIKEKYGTGNNIIVISNRLNNNKESGIEIIYPLRSNSRLASQIASDLENVGASVSKYYQLRNSDDTALDDDYLIRNTKNNQTIVIDYGNISNANDATFIKNNQTVLAEAVVKALANYAGVSYVPESLEGYYIVKSGDSLWSIASKNNTSVSVLKELNNLSSNTLQIGQILKLPSKSNTGDITGENGNDYIVQKGDSLWSIANKYDTTVGELKSLNNLSSNLLSIGQVLKLPGNNNQTTTDNTQNTYVVKSGDSLWLIANKYNTTVDELKKLNNLSSNLLSIGQVLKLPGNNLTSNSNEITYVVQNGDSLWLIANTYDTTVDMIKSANNLTSNTLQIGQVLIIPTTSKYTDYTVQKGDSLWLIASKNNTTVDELKKLNNLSSNLLSIGQKLTIPL